MVGDAKNTYVPREKMINSDWAELLQDTAESRADSSASARTPITASQPMHPEVDGAFVVRNLLSKDECNRLILAMEYEEFGYTLYDQRYRGNLRLSTVDRGLSSALWERIQAHVPAAISDPQVNGKIWRAVGLNEMFRLAKYRPGDRFAVHADACFVRNKMGVARGRPEERSMLTVNVYLNTDFEGGRTRFYTSDVKWGAVDPDQSKHLVYALEPEAGAACVFPQLPGASLMHDGEEVRGSEVQFKYLLRTDVMYRVDEEQSDAEAMRKSALDEEFARMMRAEAALRGQ